jgi:pimeloyl-ACP methyl ester carboxylesterase
MGPEKDVVTTGSVVSADGTRLGYRRVGEGPGLILLHGGVNASQHMMKLGPALADRMDLLGSYQSSTSGITVRMWRNCRSRRAR